jgi:hypothetical protein
MTQIAVSVGGRAPPGQKRRRLAQDFVGAVELPILALQLLEPVALGAGQTGAATLVRPGLSHPPP